MGKNALLLTLALLPCPALAQRAQADMSCSHTGTDFVYDCVIHIKSKPDGRPLSGVNVVVGADMPSMPMAHNVKPVKAKPGGAPGEYLARLDLEMAGEWAVKIRLSGALRDLLVVHYHFTETGRPPRK